MNTDAFDQIQHQQGHSLAKATAVLGLVVAPCSVNRVYSETKLCSGLAQDLSRVSAKSVVLFNSDIALNSDYSRDREDDKGKEG